MIAQPSRLSLRDGLVLGALVLFQALLFNTYFQRELSWHQPQNYDQAGFLVQSYRLEQDVLRDGPRAIASFLRDTPLANGIATQIEGALIALVTGGTRLPRLAVNFIFLVALQISAFLTTRAVFGGARYGYAAIGLLLLEQSVWLDPGGVFDFRFDMIASALFGLWCYALLRSRALLDPRWSAIAVAFAFLLCLHRTIAAVYVTIIYLGWFIICVATAALRERSGPARKRAVLAGLSLAGFLTALVPLAIRQYQAIVAYYVKGHLTGAEPLARAHEQGVFTLLDHLAWYPQSLVRVHLGPEFWWGAIVLLGTGVIVSRRSPPREDGVATLGLLALAVAVPIVILTIDVSKSAVVAGIAAVPVALIVINAAAMMRPARLPMAAVAALLFAGGITVTFLRGAQHASYYADRDDHRTVADLNEWLLSIAKQEGWKDVALSADILSPAFAGPAITATNYERTGDLRIVSMRLGAGQRPVTADGAAALIRSSDILVLTDHAGSGVLPFDRSIAPIVPDLEAIAARDWVLVRTVHLRRDRYRIFLRPDAAARVRLP